MDQKNQLFTHKFAAGGVALAAVLGIGCAMRGAVAQGDNHNPSNVTTSASSAQPEQGATPAPAVQSPAIQSAAAMQTAFAQVARVAEPAVVTIETERRVQQRAQNGRPRFFYGPSPFGGGNGNGRDGDGDPFEDFFRQFREFGVTPNSFKGDGILHPKNPGVRFTQATPAPGAGQLTPAGLGSGFIYDASGLILTNAHVVAGADVVTVKLLDGREFRNAKVLGSDERTDIAVVKIPANNLPSVSLGNSTKVNVGDWAIAVGNPFGLSNTLTVGVISATAREVDLAPNSANDYLQTDASINPGNSGGPLLDIYGRVIGVNNAIYSRSGGNVGIGFAIPIDTAREIADELSKNGRVRRAQLGVGIDDLENAAAYGLPAGTQGALVGQVQPDSPAARAGIRVGDVIVEFNGEKITRSADLIRRVSRANIGKPSTVTLLRDGKRITVSATLSEVPDADSSRTPRKNDQDEKSVAPNAPNTGTSIGVGLAPLTAELSRKFSLPQDAKGALVASVEENSPAARAGLRPGDLITRVGQKEISTPQEAAQAVRDLLAGQQPGSDGTKKAAVYVTRDGQGQFVIVSVPQS